MSGDLRTNRWWSVYFIRLSLPKVAIDVTHPLFLLFVILRHKEKVTRSLQMKTIFLFRSLRRVLLQTLRNTLFCFKTKICAFHLSDKQCVGDHYSLFFSEKAMPIKNNLSYFSDQLRWNEEERECLDSFINRQPFTSQCMSELFEEILTRKESSVLFCRIK